MTVKEFIKNTNEAMYRVKANGRTYLVSQEEAAKYFGSRTIKNITNNLKTTLIAVK